MKNIVYDVTVLNKLFVGSDHRAVRAKISINTKKQRTKLTRKTCRKLLTTRLSAILTNDQDIDIEQTNALIITAVKVSESKFKRSVGIGKKEMLSDSTKKLMKKEEVQRINIKSCPKRCKATQHKGNNQGNRGKQGNQSAEGKVVEE